MFCTLPKVRTNYGIFNISFKDPKYGTQLVKMNKTFGNRTYYTESQLTNENCLILRQKQILLLFQWCIFNDE